MEPNSISDSGSDPFMQTCVRCREDKPVEEFVSRTSAKRPTKWCLACRIHGHEGHKRWAANKKLKTEGSGDPQLRKDIETVHFATSPESMQVPTPSQVPYQFYPGPGHAPHMAPAPGTYGLKRPRGGFQILAPTPNQPAMYPVMWGYGSPIPLVRSQQWITSSDFYPQPAIQVMYQPSTQVSGTEVSQYGRSSAESTGDESASVEGSIDAGSSDKNSNDESSSEESSTDGTLTDGIYGGKSFHPEILHHLASFQGTLDKSPPGLDNVSSEISGEALSGSSSSNDEVDGLENESHCCKGGQEDSSEIYGSYTAPYFICLACEIPRPTRLEDSGICMYCFENPIQYCIQGGHEDDRVSFIDPEGRLHEVCNRCRSNTNPN